MDLLRREFLQLTAGAAALPIASRLARAQGYPNRPVRIVVSYPAGNASDIIGRVVAQALSERLGQQFIVENRPGVSGTLGTGVVAKASPDGYTLLMEVVTANVMNSTLYPNLNYDFARDIAPVARLGEGPYVMVVNPSVPAETLPEFVAYAKANPGKINMASGGTGTVTHVAGELFKAMAGVDMLHVPYRSDGAVITDLIGGRVQVYFVALAGAAEFIKAGKIRALAVTTAQRSPAFPDIPTVAEFVPGYEASLRNGLGAPKATPADIIARLNTEVNAALNDPKIKARFAELGSETVPLTTAEYGKIIVEETEKWGKVIKAANIKVE
jgi:tripartite-type tricarboxylate transporter receptor subunit TctC